MHYKFFVDYGLISIKPVFIRDLKKDPDLLLLTKQIVENKVLYCLFFD